MANVFLATDLRLEREVAVKIVHEHLGETHRERFVAEAKLAARLSHPNLVNVFDQGRDGPLAWLAMEYVPGVTLRDVLDRFGALPARRALEVIEAVLAGLASAHELGVLHRDLKPENVLLADDGRIKLSDWGLGRHVDQRSQTDSLVGTVAYVSPELIRRQPVDARSDVYAAGILLYELVTGQQPYRGDDAVQIAFQHAHDQVPPPSRANPATPPLIDELVLWAAASAPEHRPADAGELLAVVRQALRELRATGNLEAATRAARTERTMAATEVIGVNSSWQPDPPPSGGSPTAAFDSLLDMAPNAAVTNRASNALYDPPARTRRPLIFALVLAGAAALVGLSIGWLFAVGPLAIGQMPEVIGLAQPQAESRLTTARLDYRVITENSRDVPAGVVVRSEPAGGAFVLGGVRVYVSLGPKQLKAPNLVGLNLVDATARLVQSGLVVGSVSSWFDSAPLGTVYSQAVAAGATMPEGGRVDLKLSLGPLPLVSGMPADLARSALTAVGLVIADTREEYSETVARGKVISVSTGAGQPVGKGGAVTLVVSKGSAMAVVPKVVGETILAAKTALESRGIRVLVDTNQLQSNWGVAKVKLASVPAGTRINVTKTSVTITSR